MVIQACVIPTTREVEIRRTTVQAHLIQKVRKTPSQPTNWGMVAHIYNSSYVEGIGSRITVQCWP
jgi:hypothetical protein